MARNLSAKGKTKQQKKKEAHPEVKYNKLSLPKKVVCYNFWVGLASNKTQGWDPDKEPGSRWYWRASQFIQDSIPIGSYRRLGIVRTQTINLLSNLHM